MDLPSNYVLVFFWLCVNSLDAVWIYFYVRTATHPNPATVINLYPHQWIAFYVMMYIFGFFWGCVNIFVWYMYFLAVVDHKDGKISDLETEQSITAKITGRKARRIYWYLIHALIVVPIAIIMCLGPFFSPWAGLKITQWHVWDHDCDKFMVEAIMVGSRYYSPQPDPPHVMFYFWDGTVRTHYYDYELTGDSTNISYLGLKSVQPGVNITQVYPLVQNITYDLINQTVSAVCAARSDMPMNTAGCMEGSYKLSPYLEITTNDTRTGTISTLQAIDDNFSLNKSVDAPNFVLQDQQRNVTMRTAVTKPGGCNSLKVCLVKENGNDMPVPLGIDMLVPLGLALIPQDLYSYDCTSPSSG